jgi:5-methylcytosine-specific restriction endonuclease McrA
MPMRPPHVCGCGYKIASGELCPCQRMQKAKAEKARPGARQRGYTRDWERESKAFLARPENSHCACGCGQPAEMVDHIIPHKGDQRLFWNKANWQPMTKRCNSAKAARQEGGFGNPASPDRGRSTTFHVGGRDRAGVEILAPHIIVPRKPT